MLGLNKKLVAVCAVALIALLLISFRRSFDGFQDAAASAKSPECQAVAARKANLQTALDKATSDMLKTSLKDGIAKQDAEAAKHSC